MKPVKSHTFNGRKIFIDFHGKGVNGITDCPYRKDATATMTIFCPLNTKIGLETVIHETLHVLNWNQTEKAVEKTAEELAKFLWRIGYRLKK